MSLFNPILDIPERSLLQFSMEWQVNRKGLQLVAIVTNAEAFSGVRSKH